MKTEVRRIRGFTLVELLVSLGVVAVLVTLILGGLKTVRSSASGAKCLSNLRQIGSGTMSYLAERNGVLFPGKFFFTASFETDGGMRDYVGYDFSERTSQAPSSVYADTLFTCPELKSQTREKFQSPMLFNRTYTMNEYAMAAEDGVVKSATTHPGRTSRIPSLSRMMLIMDGSATVGSTSFHTVMNPSFVTRNFVFYPHNKGQNVLFFDGHVARLTEEEIRKPSNPRSFWGKLDMPES